MTISEQVFEGSVCNESLCRHISHHPPPPSLSLMSRRQPRELVPGAMPAGGAPPYDEEEAVDATGDAEEMEEVEDDQEGYSAPHRAAPVRR
jgi:hypothetical protein